MPQTTNAAHLAALQHTISTAKDLLTRFEATLSGGKPASTFDGTVGFPQPLHLLSTAASLLHAQITKLSLLILNKPFTPIAISQVIDTLSTSVLPSLMTAWELCYNPCLPYILQDCVKVNLSTIMKETVLLLGSIPLNEHDVEQEIGSRDTLANTGVLWHACDQLTQIGDQGVGSLAIARASQDVELFNDAIDELREWEPGEDDDLMSISSGSDDSSDHEHDDDMSSQSRLKAGALTLLQEIRDMVPKVLTTIRSFPLMNKKTQLNLSDLNRMTTNRCRVLDAMLKILHTLTETTDELVGALYSNNVNEIEQGMGTLEQIKEKCNHFEAGAWDEEHQLLNWSRAVAT